MEEMIGVHNAALPLSLMALAKDPGGVRSGVAVTLPAPHSPSHNNCDVLINFRVDPAWGIFPNEDTFP